MRRESSSPISCATASSRSARTSYASRRRAGRSSATSPRSSTRICVAPQGRARLFAGDMIRRGDRCIGARDLSGLAAAWHLADRGFTVTVCDRASRPGGLLHTFDIRTGSLKLPPTPSYQTGAWREWFRRLDSRRCSPEHERGVTFFAGRPRRWPLSITGPRHGGSARRRRGDAVHRRAQWRDDGAWGDRVIGASAGWLSSRRCGIYAAPASELSAARDFGGRKRGARRSWRRARDGAVHDRLFERLRERGVRFSFNAGESARGRSATVDCDRRRFGGAAGGAACAATGGTLRRHPDGAPRHGDDVFRAASRGRAGLRRAVSRNVRRARARRPHQHRHFRGPRPWPIRNLDRRRSRDGYDDQDDGDLRRMLAEIATASPAGTTSRSRVHHALAGGDSFLRSKRFVRSRTSWRPCRLVGAVRQLPRQDRRGRAARMRGGRGGSSPRNSLRSHRLTCVNPAAMLLRYHGVMLTSHFDGIAIIAASC